MRRRPPSGCVFHTRCPRQWGAICEREEPPLKELEPHHFLHCHIPLAELRALQASAPGAAQPVAEPKTTS
jgi:peptide/nickel transport system ATP-binding protein